MKKATGAFARWLVILFAVLPADVRASEPDELVDRYVSFNIPELRADLALLEFAEQADLTLAVRPEEVDEVNANALVGRFTLTEGAQRLLANTGLAPVLQNQMVLSVQCECKAKEQGETMKPKKAGFIAAVVAVFAGGGVNAQDTDGAADSVEEIVVTGVRGKPRTLAESPTAIDVFSAEEIQRLPQVGVFESLRFLVPSLNVPQRAGGGTATFITSAGLRGLNPDQTLILVNGKRRHKTALINTSTGLYSGSAGVDLNMIPSSAIERIEVLRDGAAAQYGSDAIAGVINIILKGASEGGRIGANAGNNFQRADGEYVNFDINQGFSLFGDGFLNLSFEFRDKQASNRAKEVPLPTDPANPGGLNLFPIVDNGGVLSFDPREFTINRRVTTNTGDFPRTTYSVAMNAGFNAGNLEVYNFSTYGYRSSLLDFTFRRPRDSRNVPEIYPFGFRPEEEIQENDFEVVTGVRGVAAGYDWDFSVGYGQDETDWHNNLGLNTSLGLSSPTSFYLGEMNASELTTQLDATKAYDLDSGQLQFSWGVQFRRENFEIVRGDEASYADGGNGAAPLAQGFPGFSPEAETDVSRNNVNAYVELGWDPTDRLFLAVAGRYEDFNDSAGEEFVWKVNGRYEISDAVALRASVNTGFRAPSIQQLGFRASRGQFIDLDNDGIAETIVLRETRPSSDDAAAALGSEPLVPETSSNYSIGVSITPANGLLLTIDAYSIEVDERIALSTQFNRGDTRAALGGGTIGDEISALLDSAGFSPALGAVNYFTNAIDTKSEGIDVVATWDMDTDFGSFQFSAAYNYSDLTVESVDPNPEELSGLILADGTPIVQFDRNRLGTYTKEIPDSKATLATQFERGGFQTSLRATRTGEYFNILNSEALDRVYDSEWIVDVEFGYEFDNGFSLFAGANNITDEQPFTKGFGIDSLGRPNFGTRSPYGFVGGNWYVRAAHTW